MKCTKEEENIKIHQSTEPLLECLAHKTLAYYSYGERRSFWNRTHSF